MTRERPRLPQNSPPPGIAPRSRSPAEHTTSKPSPRPHAISDAPPFKAPSAHTQLDTMTLYDQRPQQMHLPGNDTNRFGPALPPIQSAVMDGSAGYGGRSLPPVQLPPMRASSPLQHPPATRDASHTMSVTSLLSRNPDSPKRQHRTPLSAETASAQTQLHPPAHTTTQSSPSTYGCSPTHGRGVIPTSHPPPPHYMDQPPRQHRTEPSPPPAAFSTQQFRFSHPRYPFPTSEPDVPHHSPATSHAYSPGYYAASSEPSPTSAFLPSYSEPPAPQLSQPPPLNYDLIIRQQPVAARACGYGERDRRVIDPPPILELKTTDKATGAPELDQTGMLALHCTLLNKDGSEDETEITQAQSDGPAARRLMGSLVAAPYQAKDENGTAGTFFVFPDLSCRNPGKYRLKFTLIRIDPMSMTPGTKHPTVAHIVTELFSVYTAKDFPGMRASSALLVALRRQGLNVGVKKGSDARKGKGKAKKGAGGSGAASSDEEDEESDGPGQHERKPSNASGGTDESAGNVSPKTKKGAKGKKRRRDSQ